MAETLDPITPEAALEYYIDARRGELAKATLRDHEYRLQTFTRWLRDRDIVNMNDVDIRLIHEWRVWKREDNGEHEPCTTVTMHGQVSTLRTFLRYLTDINAVDERLPGKIRVPQPDKTERTNDRKLSAERARSILDYYRRYHYATQQHLTLLLIWRIPIRRGDVRALDVDDWESDERALMFRHRPETDTPLKNNAGSERDVILTERVAQVVDDYLESHRHYVEDEYGRQPLLTTHNGRPALGTIQRWMYCLTRPCVIGEPCPHDYDPEDCEYNSWEGAAGCPSSMPPHAIRTGSITAHRNAGTPRDVLSDRADASEDVLDEHYDKASNRQQARRRTEHIPDDL